jgi:hypothetical protein
MLRRIPQGVRCALLGTLVRRIATFRNDICPLAGGQPSKSAAIYQFFGIAESTGPNKSKQISDALEKG